VSLPSASHHFSAGARRRIQRWTWSAYLRGVVNPGNELPPFPLFQQTNSPTLPPRFPFPLVSLLPLLLLYATAAARVRRTARLASLPFHLLPSPDSEQVQHPPRPHQLDPLAQLSLLHPNSAVALLQTSPACDDTCRIRQPSLASLHPVLAKSATPSTSTSTETRRGSSPTKKRRLSVVSRTNRARRG
jgi:hypothetical protein